MRSPPCSGSGGSTGVPRPRKLPLAVCRPALPDATASNALLQLGAEEDRDDRRRRLVRAEAVILADVRDRRAQQRLVRVDRGDDRGAEEQELEVLARRVARIEQVVAGVGAHRPVVVLARAVDAGERLLVQQADEPVAAGDVLHHLHRQLLVVGADVRVLEDRRDLVLRRRDLVVTGLDRHAEALELTLGLEHAGEDALGDRAEVVLVELVALRRLGAEQRAARRVEVGPLVEVLLVDQEVLLLGADGREDARGGLCRRTPSARAARPSTARPSSAAAGSSGRAPRPSTRRTPSGCRGTAPFGFSRMKAGRRGVPGRVAARLERRADAAGRERGGVRLALDQLLARELGDRGAVADGAEERVVLLGRQARERLEPVRVVGRALLHRPLAHRLGDGVGERRIERRARWRASSRACGRRPSAGAPSGPRTRTRSRRRSRSPGCGQVGRPEGVAVCAPLRGADVLLSRSAGHRDLEFLLLDFRLRPAGVRDARAS